MDRNSNPIVEKSMKFAIQIVRAYQFLCKERNEYILSNQLLRSGTSIGANVKEATRAESKADFIHKMQIALKEASESEYWIELLKQTDYFNEKQSECLTKNCEEIIKILTSIIRTTKNNRNAKK